MTSTTAPTAPTAPSAGTSPSAGTTAVRLRGLTRHHREVRALDGVDLDFATGTFTAVMGPSGSGKSTLLQCAAGLDRPTAGRVEVDGVALEGLSERRLALLRRDRIGFVFQSFNLLPALTAAQNVALPLRLAGRRPSRTEVREALARVGLAGRERHRPGELSGGQQQRVAIARALITGPAVLFGDEPTGALDSTTSREVLDMLRELVDRDGRTIVMVTHDPVAAARADRVVFLADGRVAGELTSPTVESVTGRMTALETTAAVTGPGTGPVTGPGAPWVSPTPATLAGNPTTPAGGPAC
ncbi:MULTISPECIES: ABC transporter ATP-binding protein [unclassified Streptomyces]|uniref:ABC transporter ATP-binding protein n=1 Tax=unclassified Streptomyces TaxID=2593676 RepID=UPI0006FA5F55|nr:MULTISPECIES: ABC transporter ATP-binding protein [unclassified Streptomyces]KQX45611.1 ABC transporter [Streptomyces sp. Root1304]KRA79555.1 ABC transporter [Streptomyces sp. Root66D1]